MHPQAGARGLHPTPNPNPNPHPNQASYPCILKLALGAYGAGTHIVRSAVEVARYAERGVAPAEMLGRTWVLQELAACYLLLATCYLLLATCDLLLTAHCSLLTAHCSLLTAHY